MIEVVEKIAEAIEKTLTLGERVQGGRWVIGRCKYCSDSLNPNNKHFGVYIPQTENEVFRYNCFKCHTKDKLTTDDLMSWGCNDPGIIELLGKWQKRVGNLPQNNIYKNSKFQIKNDIIEDEKLAQCKLNYINKRLGLSLSLRQALDLKIIFNCLEMMNRNSINKIYRDKNIIQFLNNAFVGFLSQDGAFINFRRLVKEEKVPPKLRSRYVKYSLFGKYNNTESYYTIPSNIDLYDIRKIKLIIAEGPMDILSILFNVFNGDRDHKIFTSIGGSGYLQVIEHFLVKEKLINLEVHIFKDSDVPLYQMERIQRLLKKFNIPLFVHENVYEGEKDYGVCKEKIIDKIIME